MTTKKYKEIIEPLVSYSLEKMGEVNLRDVATVTLTYEIIREAIADLHSNSLKYQEDAREYFNSNVFLDHCRSVCISKQLMLQIVLNPDKYAPPMQYHMPLYSLDWVFGNESDIEFSDLP